LISEINDFGIHGYETFHQNQEVVTILVKELMDDLQKNSAIKSTALGVRPPITRSFTRAKAGISSTHG